MGTVFLSPYASMAPAGGKVSPTASNVPVSARVPQSSTDQDADATDPWPRAGPSLRGRLDDERRLTGGAHLGAGCRLQGQAHVQPLPFLTDGIVGQSRVV